MDDGEKSQSFVFQPVAKRTAIVVAGPVANFLLAIVIFAGIFMFYGKQTMTARVDTVQPDSAAAAAGFQPGDLVIAINGSAIGDFADMQRVVSESAGEPLNITVDRNGTRWSSRRRRRSRRSRTFLATRIASAFWASPARPRRKT